MKLHNIEVIADYEVRLLRRSWLFRIFSILALCGLAVYTLWKQTYIIDQFSNIWLRIALSSLMPFTTTYYYNIAQSVIVIFLAGSFLKRDRKLDTAEVIYVRPISNADYVFGKSWGIIKVFLSLNVIALLVTALLNVAVNRSPFSLWPYVFYLLTVSLPSLVFVLGLSFTLMCLLKNQAVTMILMLGSMGLVFFYLPDEWFGIFDFFGVNIPALLSDVDGHPYPGRFLLQRSVYLALGTGLITLTAALVQRLPQKPWKKKVIFLASGAFLLAAVGAGTLYIGCHTEELGKHRSYAECYNRYAPRRNVQLLSQDLEIRPQAGSMSARSRIRLKNPLQEGMQDFILFLNPGLEVVSVTGEGRSLPYTRDCQAVCIRHGLAPGENYTVEVEYRGRIDESICYTDVAEEEYTGTRPPKGIFRFGKRYAWLEEDYVLLTPECLWYPVAFAPAYPASPYQLKKNFSRFSLKVVCPEDRTVLSQGYMERSGDTATFTNLHSLPGISLTVADYGRMAVRVDSTDYEIYHFKGHDYFTREMGVLADTLPILIREMKSDLERQKDRDYPSHKFVIAETPASFATYIRNWKGYTENVMPEILFFPERGVHVNADFKAANYRNRYWSRRYNGEPDKGQVEAGSLKNFVQAIFTDENIKFDWARSAERFVNPYNIIPMFLNHMACITSPDYPVLDAVTNLLQNTDESRTGFNPWKRMIDDSHKANLYLGTHSLKEALADGEISQAVLYELLKMKSTALKNYIYTRIAPEEFDRFLKLFLQARRFSNIPFKEFQQALEDSYGVDLKDFLYHWYMDRETPAVHIRDVSANQVVMDEETRYSITFKVNNPSATDALITTNVQTGEYKGRRRRGQKRKGPGSSKDQIGHYGILAGQAYEIRIITNEQPSKITINTNISQNLPNSHTFNFAKIDTESADTLAGQFPITAEAFQTDPRVIVIDNESPGFRTISSNSRHKLKDLLQKEEKEKYHDFYPWQMPSRWTLAVADFYYGEIISSATYKKKGRGNNSVEWSTPISREGYYTVSIWNPRLEEMSKHMRYYNNGEDRDQTYTVIYGDEREDITLNLEREAPGWVSLGNFYLPEGTASIVLTDKVSGNYVIADAVRFTYLDE